MRELEVKGKKIVWAKKQSWETEEEITVAICDKPEEAMKLLARGWYVQERFRKYTECARLFYQAEQLPGFQWAKVSA